MLRVHEYIGKKYGFSDDALVKMLLQVHDELVFEMDASVLMKHWLTLSQLWRGWRAVSTASRECCCGKKMGEMEKVV